MSDTEENPAVLVELAPPFDDVAKRPIELRKFEERLLALIDDLVKDLALPVDPLVQVRAASQQAAGSDPIRLWLNCQPCRVVRFSPAWPEPSELFPVIATAIVANRELFISPELAQRMAERFSTGASAHVFDGLAADQVHRLLVGRLQRGFRVDRAAARSASRNPPKKASGSAGSPSNDLLPDFDAVGLKVFVRNPNDPIWAKAWDEELSFMTDGLFDELGLLLPPVHREEEGGLKPEEFRIQINDLRHPPVTGLHPNEILVNDTPERLPQKNLNARKAISPVTGHLVFSIVKAGGDLAKTLESAGLTTWDPLGCLVLHLAIAIRRNAGSLLTNGIVRQMLNTLEGPFPQLVEAARVRCSVPRLRRILQLLLDEGISIRDLRNILESILDINGTTDVERAGHLIFIPPASKPRPLPSSLDTTDIDICVEHVRRSLQRAISHKYARGTQTQTLVAYLLDPKIEQRIRESSRSPLTAQECSAILGAVGAEAQFLPPTAQLPVILTAPEIRRAVRELIAGEFTSMQVTSYAEIPPGLNVQPVARILLLSKPPSVGEVSDHKNSTDTDGGSD